MTLLLVPCPGAGTICPPKGTESSLRTQGDSGKWRTGQKGQNSTSGDFVIGGLAALGLESGFHFGSTRCDLTGTSWVFPPEEAALWEAERGRSQRTLHLRPDCPGRGRPAAGRGGAGGRRSSGRPRCLPFPCLPLASETGALWPHISEANKESGHPGFIHPVADEETRRGAHPPLTPCTNSVSCGLFPSLLSGRRR